MLINSDIIIVISLQFYDMVNHRTLVTEKFLKQLEIIKRFFGDEDIIQSLNNVCFITIQICCFKPEFDANLNSMLI